MAQRAERAVKTKGNADDAVGYVERIENLDAEIDDIMREAKQRCQSTRDAKKIVFKEAADNGVAKKPLAAAIRKRRLERRAKSVRGSLDENQAETFDQILHALGDLAETPLGQAALATHAA